MNARHAVSILVAGLATLSFSAGAWAWQGGHSRSHISGGVRHFESSHFPGPRHFHGGFHSRVIIGGTFYAPLYYPPYYYDPYYYAPPPVEYVQPAPPQPWYYCASARAYYPYVQACPEGWQQVLPPQQ